MTAQLPSKTARGERIVYVEKDLGGREYPANLEAEAAVLSAILTDDRKLDRALGALEAAARDQGTEVSEMFYGDSNRRIFAAALALRAQATPIDVQTIAGWLKDRDWLHGVGGVSYLAHVLDSTPAIAHVEAYAKIVRDKWRVRRLIDQCRLISAMGFGDYGATEDYLADAEREIFSLTRVCDDSESTLMRDLVRAEEARLDSIERGDYVPLGVSTGLSKLDGVLTDLRPAEVTVIAGKSQHGKTSLAMGIVDHVASTPIDGVQQGCFVGSIEMKKDQLVRKLASQRAGVPVKRINRGELTPRERDIVREANIALQELHIEVDDVGGMTPARLRSKIRRAQAAFDAPGRRRLSVFVVDYIQRMKADVKCDSREREVASCVTAVTEIAKETGLHGIILAQLNREGDRRGGKEVRPRLSDLRESAQIEMDAHNIVFTHLAWKYKKTEDVTPDEREVADLIIAKQREGATDDVQVRFDGYCTRFRDLEQVPQGRPLARAPRRSAPSAWDGTGPEPPED